MNTDKELKQMGLEQLAEKQMEEMDQMLAKRYGLQPDAHTDDQIRASTFSDLFSGLPYDQEHED